MAAEGEDGELAAVSAEPLASSRRASVDRLGVSATEALTASTEPFQPEPDSLSAAGDTGYTTAADKEKEAAKYIEKRG